MKYTNIIPKYILSNPLFFTKKREIDAKYIYIAKKYEKIKYC